MQKFSLAIPSQKHWNARAAIYLYIQMYTKYMVHATHLPN